MQVDLVAELAGVAGARHAHPHAVEIEVLGHPVVGDLQDLLAEQAGHDFPGLRPLDLDRRHVHLADRDIQAGVVGQPLGPQPDVGVREREPEAVVLQPQQHRVVGDPAVRQRDEHVLRLAHRALAQIARGHHVGEGERVRSGARRPHPTSSRPPEAPSTPRPGRRSDAGGRRGCRRCSGAPRAGARRRSTATCGSACTTRSQGSPRQPRRFPFLHMLLIPHPPPGRAQAAARPGDPAASVNQGPPGMCRRLCAGAVRGLPCGHAQGPAVVPAGHKLRGNHRHDPGRGRLQPEPGRDIGRPHSRIMQHLHTLRREHLTQPSRHAQDCAGAAAEADARTRPRVIRTTGTASIAVPAACRARVRRPAAGRSALFVTRWNTTDPHGGPNTRPAPRQQRGTGRRAARPAVRHPGHLSTSETTAGEHPLIDAAARPAARERG